MKKTTIKDKDGNITNVGRNSTEEKAFDWIDENESAFPPGYTFVVENDTSPEGESEYKSRFGLDPKY